MLNLIRLCEIIVFLPYRIQLIVKNKQYSQSGRLRINMGNIYYEQKKYPQVTSSYLHTQNTCYPIYFRCFPQAIKMYRMALDQIPATGKELRYVLVKVSVWYFEFFLDCLFGMTVRVKYFFKIKHSINSV